MTTFDLFSTAKTQDHGMVARLQLLADRLRQTHAQRTLYRRTLRELSALSDAELGDIGLTRGMIRSAAREACTTI